MARWEGRSPTASAVYAALQTEAHKGAYEEIRDSAFYRRFLETATHVPSHAAVPASM